MSWKRRLFLLTMVSHFIPAFFCRFLRPKTNSLDGGLCEQFRSSKLAKPETTFFVCPSAAVEDNHTPPPPTVSPPECKLEQLRLVGNASFFLLSWSFKQENPKIAYKKHNSSRFIKRFWRHIRSVFPLEKKRENYRLRLGKEGNKGASRDLPQKTWPIFSLFRREKRRRVQWM